MDPETHFPLCLLSCYAGFWTVWGDWTDRPRPRVSAPPIRHLRPIPADDLAQCWGTRLPIPTQPVAW